jgi:hypothetical protein
MTGDPLPQPALRELFIGWFDYYAARGAPAQVPPNASEARVVWDHSIERWNHDLAAVTDARLLEPLGPEARQFGNDPVASFVEHIHDEFIHHTAEIGLLRDLYRCRLDGDG